MSKHVDDATIARRRETALRLWDEAKRAVGAAGFVVPPVNLTTEVYPPSHFPSDVIATTGWGSAGWGDPCEAPVPRINAWMNHKFWDDPAKFEAQMHRDGFIGVADPRRVLVHELGHAILSRPSRMIPILQHVWGRINELQQAAWEVSGYSAWSPIEFIAEVFAGIVLGRKFSSEVMSAYHALGGKDGKAAQ